MKLLMEPIEVQADTTGPRGFRWRGRWYRVREISQEWAWRGRWWTDPLMRGERRRYYRVVADGPHTAGFEIFEREGQWVLSRLLD